jgi:hypothetical protein
VSTSESTVLPVPVWTLVVRPSPSRTVVVKCDEPLPLVVVAVVAQMPAV